MKVHSDKRKTQEPYNIAIEEYQLRHLLAVYKFILVEVDPTVSEEEKIERRAEEARRENSENKDILPVIIKERNLIKADIENNEKIVCDLKEDIKTIKSNLGLRGLT